MIGGTYQISEETVAPARDASLSTRDCAGAPAPLKCQRLNLMPYVLRLRLGSHSQTEADGEDHSERQIHAPHPR